MEKNSQHNIRESIIFFIYQQQLLNYDLETIIKEIKENEEDFNTEITNNLIHLFEQREIIIKIINKYLKVGWHFSKLSNLEQGILLWATYELLILKENSAIIINEAVLITKKYFINSEYKYINGILQSIADNEKKTNKDDNYGKWIIEEIY
ncbi:transcription antitermination protein NusB [Spiroplasma endosymbiont of Nephrotoma flavescens]|uniref:transcription antitermination protein NusB n=1 Tax=Spiroplasma endosymbiont of Nephrotoma flavescens TaxID=3066302 RepID=UPI00313D9008